MDQFKSAEGLSSELSVEVLIRGVLALEQSEAKKVFKLLEKGLENLVAQNIIPSDVAKQFRQLRAKKIKEEKRMEIKKIFCEEDESLCNCHVNGILWFEIECAGIKVFCQSHELFGWRPRFNAFAIFGERRLSAELKDKRLADVVFGDEVELLNFVYEKAGVEAVRTLLSDRDIDWLWEGVGYHLWVKGKLDMPLTEEEMVWFGVSSSSPKKLVKLLRGLGRMNGKRPTLKWWKDVSDRYIVGKNFKEVLGF